MRTFDWIPRTARLALVAGWSMCAATAAMAFEVCPASTFQQCPNSCTFEVPILVSGTGHLDALGLDFVYTGTASYASWRRGGLVRDWDTFNLASIAWGRLRLGGYDLQGSNLNGSDTLAVVVFSVTASQCLAYRTEGMVDDLAGALPCDGQGQADVHGGMIWVRPHVLVPGCCYSMGQQDSLEVWGSLPYSGSYQSVEFRLEFWPPVPGASFLWQPEVGVLSTGDPIDNTSDPNDASGVLLRFACTTYPYPVYLGRVQFTGLDTPCEVRVKRPLWQTPNPRTCAGFVSCPPNCELRSCLDPTLGDEADPIAFRALINGDCSSGGMCVAVAPRTWTDVKRLYR
jgi:hypothetical protein